MISVSLMTYLNLDKAEQGEKISQLVRELYDKECARKTLYAQISTIEYWLSEKLLRKPENLHFKDYDSAVYYFGVLVEEVMYDWNSETKIKEVLTDCYIDGILYSPRFDGDKCPVCGYLNEHDFEKWYLSYPVLNYKEGVSFCCSECDHEFSVGVTLKLSLEIDDE